MKKLILAGVISAIALVPAAHAAQAGGAPSFQPSPTEFQRGDRGWRNQQSVQARDEQRAQRRSERRNVGNVGIAEPQRQRGDGDRSTSRRDARQDGRYYDRNRDGSLDRRWDRNRDGDLDRRWDRNGNERLDRRWDRDDDERLDRRWDRDRNGDLDRRWDRNNDDRVDRRDRWDREDRGTRWNSGWRSDRRYDWRGHRDRYRSHYRPGRYYAPYRDYRYRRFSVGVHIGSPFFASRYWIADPWQYRLPPAHGPYRWVRYYDDVLLVDMRNGYVVDVIHDFFW